MKKAALLAITVLVAFLATSCDKEKRNEYAGKYTGVFSVIVADSVVQTDGELSFSSGVTKEKNLYLYGTLLTKESDSKYTGSSSALSTIIFLVFGIETEKVENVDAVFTFSDTKVNAEIKYKLSGATEINLVSFDGNRQ